MRRLRRHDPLWRVLLPSCHFRLEEQENTKLKRLIANLSMDNLVLKDIAWETSEPGTARVPRRQSARALKLNYFGKPKARLLEGGVRWLAHLVAKFLTPPAPAKQRHSRPANPTHEEST